MMTLTKEEVEDKIELIIDSDTGSDCTALIDALFAHDAEQRQRIEELEQQNAALREALKTWQSLFRQAVSTANGLTNYVEDRPELHHAERRLALLEQQALKEQST